MSSKKIYNLFNAKEIVKYYNIYHTFDIEQACEKMMESIGYKSLDLEKEAYKLLKKLIIREKLENMLGEDVKVYIDRQIGFKHPNYNDIIYGVNYGYIKDIISTDGEYQDVYVLGENYPIKECMGKVYAIVEREDDEDKLIVKNDDKEYSKEELINIINFQEKYFKYRIVK